MIGILKRLWNSSFVRWAAPVAWMGVIFYLSAQSTLPLVGGGWADVQSIAGHFTEYAVLALLWQRALTGAGLHHATRWALVVAMLYGLSDEFHQHFVPGRLADPFDYLADVAGAGVALWAASWLWTRLGAPRFRQRSSRRA